MDTVWIAYIRDRRHDLYLLNNKKYKDYADIQDMEAIVGVYDSQSKAEKALDIVMRRMGWRGISYHPNVWVIPEQFEYGWKSMPFNQFNAQDLYTICHFGKRD